jgi:arylsulfatase A-like enzyme
VKKINKKGNSSPNVIFLLLDALTADRLHLYGNNNEFHPALDDFSKDAVTFKKCISQASTTLLSVPSILTSVYPSSVIKFEDNWLTDDGKLKPVTVNPAIPTLQEFLRNDGYETGAVVANSYLRTAMPDIMRGFDYIYYENKSHGNSAKKINKKTFKCINKFKGGRFFLYTHYMDLHSPYAPPLRYLKHLPKDFRRTWPARIWKKKFSKHMTRKWDRRLSLPPEDIELMFELYMGELRYLDEQIGELMNDLKRRSLYDNSLIVIASDHGEAFGEHELYGHGKFEYREFVHVPLLIKFPRQEFAGKIMCSQVRNIDILPTILDYLEIEGNDQIEGVSLLPFIRGNEPAEDLEAFTEGFYIRWIKYALRKNGYFIYLDRQNEEEVVEIYDTARDWSEKNDASREIDKDIFQNLYDSIESYIGKRSDFNAGSYDEIMLEKEQVKRLQSLGYL